MIHSSASFTFFKKSKSLHEEVSGLCAWQKSVNRPPILYCARCAHSTYNIGALYINSLHYIERHAESHTAPTRRGTNKSYIIRAYFLLLSVVSPIITYGLIIPYPDRTGWIRKNQKSFSRRPVKRGSPLKTTREENS